MVKPTANPFDFENLSSETELGRNDSRSETRGDVTPLYGVGDSNPGYEHHAPRRKLLWTRPLLLLLPLAVSIVPLGLLLAFAGKLSKALAYNACGPSGEFVLPFTSSVWASNGLFDITIAFSGPQRQDCPPGSDTTLGCDGYTFTQVKLIDISWDVLIGRGGQAVAVYFAYRLFTDAVRMLMANGEVGYDLFSAMAFESGSFSSLWPLLRHAVGFTPIPRTRHATIVYWAIGLATAYIVAMPTLISAITGYTSHYSPFINMGSQANVIMSQTDGLKFCHDTLYPVWGRLQSNYAVDSYDPEREQSFPIAYDHPPYYTMAGPEWVECELSGCCCFIILD
jgi:hypothetical protein